MAQAATRWWVRWRLIVTWVALEQMLPGVTLFALLVWLSGQYLRDGFAQVRHHALAPAAAKGALIAPVRKNWWSCTCASAGVCRCRAAVAAGLKHCCVNLLSPALRLQAA